MKIRELLTEGYNILKEENIESYMIDTQLLLCHVIQKDRIFLITNREYEVDIELENKFKILVEERKKRKPIKYIIGKTEFMGLDFNIEEGVLIPRADTEILVEKVIDSIRENSYNKVCDVCCGSGVIGISIAKLSSVSEVNLYDISEKAIEVTKMNIKQLSVNEIACTYKSDLLKRAIGDKIRFDVIVSNPPYIREDVIPSLMKDVKDYEPYIALSGGKDGLYFYREITKQSLEVLNKNGLLAYEIGYDQKDDVFRIMEQNGFKKLECVKDLAGNDRVIIGKLN
ncbi:peptide chain release factor N(5)-glutamine methyltransferase [Clostridium sp. DL1XJH146]